LIIIVSSYVLLRCMFYVIMLFVLGLLVIVNMAIEIHFKRLLGWPYGFGTIVSFKSRPIVSCTLLYPRYQALRTLRQETTQSFLSENKIIANTLISGDNIG